MFSSFRSRNRVSKTVKPIKRSVGERSKLKMQQKLDSPMAGSSMISPIITLVVGPDLRLFAAYEHALLKSPYFAKRLRDQFYETSSKRLKLPDMLPEVFACVLEYLYTDDYFPRLCKSKRHHSWELEDAHQDTHNSDGRGRVPFTLYHPGVDGNYLLTDTVVYCAAEELGLEELKRLALIKQGLRSCAPDDVLIRSARYAYANTLATDRRLRPFFIELIIQDRRFIRSPTMQMEMGLGGSKLFFDLFVAVCRHMDEFVERANKSSPRTI